MIHVGDNTWNLRVVITDLQVEKTLRVKGDLHIGGVMLKLSKTEGELAVLISARPKFDAVGRCARDADERIFRCSMNQIFCFPPSRSRISLEKEKFIIFLLKITLKVTCVCWLWWVSLRVFHHRARKRSRKIVGEVVRLRHVQGQRPTVPSADDLARPPTITVAKNVSDGANDVTCHRDCHFLLHNSTSPSSIYACLCSKL